MQKFVITQEGELRFGDVCLHKDLLPSGDGECRGGGFWQVSANGLCIELYGRSYDFGSPDFTYLQTINRSGLGGLMLPLIYYPCYPDSSGARQIFVG